MDNNYFNANGTRPDWSGPPGLAGVLAARDQQRNQQVQGLQQLLQTQHFSDYMQDAPVRQQTRLGDIAFQRGRAATAEEGAKEDLATKVVSNRFNERTLNPRVQQQFTAANKGEHDFKYQQMTDGLSHLSALANIVADSPDSGAIVRQKAKELGIHEEDPVIRHIMDGASPDEMRQRIIYAQNELHKLRDKQYATSEMTANKDLTKAILDANVRLDVARQRTPHEKISESRWDAYQRDVRNENPTWDDSRIKAEAVKRMDAAQYGGGKPGDDAERKQVEDTIKSYKQILGYIPDTSPLKKQLQMMIQQLESSRRPPARTTGGGPRAGTPENPIVIK